MTSNVKVPPSLTKQVSKKELAKMAVKPSRSKISWEMKGLAPNQIELLKNSPDFTKQLEDKYSVCFNFHSSFEPIQYECTYQNKSFKFVQMSIIDVEVDAIVSPHGQMITNNPKLVQGTGKIIIEKAGSNYQSELSTKGKLNPSEIFTTDAYELKNCKKIINIYSPPYSSDSKYCNILMKSYANIFEEAEKQGISKLGLTLLGCGGGGFPLDDGFSALFKFLHDSFFQKDLKNLKEIYLCEIDEKKIIKLREIIQKKTTYFPEKRTSVYLWKWRDDDQQFKVYDEYINDLIDEHYEKFLKDKKDNIIKVDFIAHKQPGTHQFNLDTMIVKDIARIKTEKLSINEHNEWCHGNSQRPYDGYISEIINLKKLTNTPIFELFLKKYYLDFKNMKQINRATKFQREITKEPLIISSENDITNFVPRIKFEINEINLDLAKNKLIILGDIENNDENTSQIDKEIRNFLSSRFKEIEKRYNGLANEKHEKIYQFCKNNGIYFKKDKICSEDIFSFVVPNDETWKKFGKFLENIMYPWDNEDAQFKVVELKENENDYEFVASKFNKSLPGIKILSIKRIQNKELYNTYQTYKAKVKRDLQDVPNICKNFQNYEQFLWHGTKSVEPNTLISRYDTWLNKNYSSIKNLWGNGTYFAEKASYSIDYAYKTEKSKILILAQVFVGESFITKPDNSLKEPPTRPGLGQLRYNSVQSQGDAAGSKIFVVYGENQSYPAYMVEYEL